MYKYELHNSYSFSFPYTYVCVFFFSFPYINFAPRILFKGVLAKEHLAGLPSALSNSCTVYKCGVAKTSRRGVSRAQRPKEHLQSLRNREHRVFALKDTPFSQNIRNLRIYNI